MRIGLSDIHRLAPPSVMFRRGIGQTAEQTALTGAIPTTPINLQDALESFVGSLSAEPPADAAVNCGSNGGTPCASPSDFANSIYGYAASICSEAGSAESLVGSLDPNCANNGAGLAAQYYQQLLAIANSWPASVWQTEAQNAASGNYYGTAPAGPCPAGMFVQVGPNGVSCYGSTANQDLVNTPVQISPSVPVVTAPTPVAAPTISPAPAASSPAPSVSTNAQSQAPAGSQAQSSAPSPFAFLTEDSFDGIQNWVLIAAGVAALFVLPKLFGGRS